MACLMNDCWSGGSSSLWMSGDNSRWWMWTNGGSIVVFPVSSWLTSSLEIPDHNDKNTLMQLQKPNNPLYLLCYITTYIIVHFAFKAFCKR